LYIQFATGSAVRLIVYTPPPPPPSPLTTGQAPLSPETNHHHSEHRISGPLMTILITACKHHPLARTDSQG